MKKKRKKERKDPDKKKRRDRRRYEGKAIWRDIKLQQKRASSKRILGGGREEAEIVDGSEVLERLWCNLGSRLATAEVKNCVYACVLSYRAAAGGK